MKLLYKIFIKGILTILPLIITLALLYWIFSIFETFFGGMLRQIMPKDMYHLGMGLALGIVAIFCIGLVVQFWFGKKLFQWFEALVNRIPVIKDIYESAKQAQALFVKQEGKKGRPVIFTMPNTELKMIGIVMNDKPHSLLDGKLDDRVPVFLPMSYQVGGFTLYIERSHLQPLDISVEKAFKLAITAGIGKEEKEHA